MFGYNDLFDDPTRRILYDEKYNKCVFTKILINIKDSNQNILNKKLKERIKQEMIAKILVMLENYQKKY